jgi:hypothetical protein
VVEFDLDDAAIAAGAGLDVAAQRGGQRVLGSAQGLGQVRVDDLGLGRIGLGMFGLARAPLCLPHRPGTVAG